MTMELRFYGAADRVTGSCHILRVGAATILLDCGMIQGARDDEEGNAEPFPFDPADIDAVVLSHAHIDHSGRLPLLVKRGFRGPIYTQHATRALLDILLKDAANLELNASRRENRWRADQGRPAIEPLFTRDDVDGALQQTRGCHYEEPFDPLPDRTDSAVTVRFHDAGHIMGSAVVEVTIAEHNRNRNRDCDRDRACTLVFSGDLGPYDSPILRDPVTPAQADVVLMETTYGDRNHRDRTASLIEFGEVLERAHRDGGNVLIPAFAVGRSQEVLYQLGKHFDDWNVQRWRIFLDSPLAIEASQVYWDFEHLFDTGVAEIFRGDETMPALPNLHFTRSAGESRVINRMQRGAIIIAGSGMCNGGRILHHFKRDLGRPQTHLIFTGFQPPGGLGRRIIDGAESVRIHGETVPVRAQIHTIGGLSAHADQRDLLRWYAGFRGAPDTFLVHGEPRASAAFREALAAAHPAQVSVAEPGLCVDLTPYLKPFV